MNFMPAYFAYFLHIFAYFSYFSHKVHNGGVHAYFFIFFAYLYIFLHIFNGIYLHTMQFEVSFQSLDAQLKPKTH